MKAPFCTFCVKTGVLCLNCQKKLESEYSELDFNLTKFLVEREQKYPFLQDIRLHRVVSADSVLVILVEKGDLIKFLIHGKKLLRELASNFGKKVVKIVERDENIRRIFETLFAPANVVSVNKVWLPDNTVETKVIIPEHHKKKIPIRINTLKEICKRLLGVNLRIEFMKAR